MLKHLSFRGIMIPIMLVSASLNSFSQSRSEEYRKKILSNEKVSSVLISQDRQTPSFIALKNTTPTYSKSQIKPALDNFLGVRAGFDQTLQDKETKNGVNEVVEFQQYYKGVKVDRAKFKVFLKNGQAEFFNGAWYAVPATLSTTPVLSRIQALAFAKSRIDARKYMPELIIDRLNSTIVASSRALLQKELQENSYGGDLVIIKDFDKESTGGDVRLAYKFNIYAAEPLSRSWVYVDANTGRILLVDKIIKHVGEEPTGVASVSTAVQTRYAGTRNIFVKQISGNDPQNGLTLVASNPLEVYIPGSLTYGLMDDTRGKGIETYDLNGLGGVPLNISALYSQAKSFTDVDNNWLLSEHMRGGAVESENDDFGWDAHWGAAVVYDYWKNNHNRLSFDAKDGKIKSFIHSGLAFDNAYWNGSVMTYGDGSGTAANGFKPLTSLDVCGHEIGHGVCEFTADLVYAKESGAMNEGFSDIWAACVEYFAIKTVDPALASVYKPFSIGEQITKNPAVPLRRMDNPKAKTDPDTYAGQYWTSQNCSPTLANDQCGVHNNSGVLNKWFYLLTVGSGTGSGPDAAFAGQDDGINDAVTTGPVELQHPANPYQVTGLGFAMSERLSYLTELLLTTTATFAEAREVSIAVATEVSGNPCSAIVESVTNAWYAVGVGPQFVKPCTITYGFVTRNGSTVSENTPTNGCSASKTINISVVLPPNSTASVSASGTAGPLDYSISNTSLTNTTASIAKQDLVVVINNDGATETDESVQLSLTVSNTGANPVNNAYRLTILDDDVVPVIGVGQSTLLSETFTRADGFADPAGWTEVLEVPEAPNGDPVAAGKNQWGIFDNKLAITGKEGLTGIQQPGGTYNNSSPSQTLIKSSLLDARGQSVITLKFDYTIQGEVDLTAGEPENMPVFDYMAVAYSLDGINFVELTSGDFRQFASLAPESGTITGLMPASLANKQFYLAFRWFNDTNAGGPISVSIDNLTVTAAPKTIENDLGHNGRENLSPMQEVYFYSIQDGQVVSKIRNESSRDFGCTNVAVEKTGNGAFNLYQNNQGLHKVGDKIIRVESAVSSKSATKVTLFYTEAQLQGLEYATGMDRTQFSVYHVQDISYSVAGNNNTKRYAPVYTSLPGVGGYYTVAFTDRANGSYALGAQVTVFARTEPVSNDMDRIDWNFERVSPNPMQTTGFIEVNAPTAQRIKMDIVTDLRQRVISRSITVPQGIYKIPVPATLLKAGKYVITLSDEKGNILNTQVFLKY